MTLSKIWDYVLRFGPLFAALALGAVAVVPAIGPVVSQILSALGVLGVVPDPNLTAELGNLVVGALALLGVARKVYNLIKAYFTPTV